MPVIMKPMVRFQPKVKPKQLMAAAGSPPPPPPPGGGDNDPFKITKPFIDPKKFRGITNTIEDYNNMMKKNLNKYKK